MKFDFKQFIVPHFWKKFVIMLVAIFFMGFFLSFLLDVNWGTDPYTFQNTIISQRLRDAFGPFWSFGTFQLILNAVVLVIVIIFDWHLVGLGTIANMTLIGYTSDLFRHIWKNCAFYSVYSEPSLLWAKILIFIAALFFFVVAAAFYMNADMGLSPYDALPKIISDRLPKISYTIIRIIYDCTPIVIGLLFCIGSSIHFVSALIGSVAMSFSLGPMITFVGKRMKKWFFKEDLPASGVTEDTGRNM